MILPNVVKLKQRRVKDASKEGQISVGVDSKRGISVRKFEQVAKSGLRKGGYEKYLKKATNRALRRAAKEDPETAPRAIKELLRGYVS